MNLFETERLAVRRFEERDAGFVLALVNDPGFVANIGDRGVRTIADAHAYLAQRYLEPYAVHGFGMYRVAVRATDTPIGSVGLVCRDGLPAPDLGFAYLEEYCRRGFGEEAARGLLDWADATLRLPRLLAITAPHNQASAGLLGKLGFLETGRVTLPGHGSESRLFERQVPGGDVV